MKASALKIALVTGVLLACAPLRGQLPVPPEPPAPPHAPAASSGPVYSTDQSQSTYSVLTDREPLTSLDGLWRFQPGDDPHWSDPHFDDSHWAMVNSQDDWAQNGFPHLTGLAWYRFRIVLPAGEEPYSLRLPVIYTCYEVFVDGRLALTEGRLPPHAGLYRTRPTIIDISDDARPETQTVTIALRVWQDPEWNRYHHGGLQGSAEVGRSDLIHAAYRTESEAHLWQYSDDIDLGVLDLLAFVISLSLFLSRRSEREFFWFALLILGQAGYHLVSAWGHAHIVRVAPTDFISDLCVTLFLVASVFFYKRLFGAPWTRSSKLAMICCGLFFLIGPLRSFGALSVAATNFFGLLVTVPIYAWIIFFLRRRARERRPDARMLRRPVTILFFSMFYTQFIWVLLTAGLTFASHLEFKIHHPLYLTLDDVAEGFFLIAMLAILLSRFARTRREQDRVASELEAARSMQQVLVPESLPSVPGLSISTAYHPAEEVGGDFFQVLPLRSGATLFVVGDVAGKGLPAALAVSLAVGALRTIADYTESPGEVLTALNRRLFGRGPGFTTCLALNLSADRTVLTLANAGHLPPYVNGYELHLEPNLPLGLDPDATFVECRYRLNPGDHLTVLTDGVPEAMHGRELFGFERTHKLSRETAAHIADAARSFGQSDDITVLTIDILAVPTTEHETPVLQTA